MFQKMAISVAEAFSKYKIFFISIGTLVLALIVFIPLALLIGAGLQKTDESPLKVAVDLVGIAAGLITIFAAVWAVFTANDALSRWREKVNDNCLERIWGARKNVSILKDYVERDILSFDNHDVPERAAASAILFDEDGGFRRDRLSRALKNILELEDVLFTLQARSDSPKVPEYWNKLHPGRHLLDEVTVILEIREKINEDNLSDIVTSLGVEGDKGSSSYYHSSSGKIKRKLAEVESWLDSYEKKLLK